MASNRKATGPIFRVEKEIIMTAGVMELFKETVTSDLDTEEQRASQWWASTQDGMKKVLVPEPGSSTESQGQSFKHEVSRFQPPVYWLMSLMVEPEKLYV